MEYGQELPRLVIGDDEEGQEEEGGEEEEVVMKATLDYVLMEGKLPKECFVDLMEYMVVRWDEQGCRRV